MAEINYSACIHGNEESCHQCNSGFDVFLDVSVELYRDKIHQELLWSFQRFVHMKKNRDFHQSYPLNYVNYSFVRDLYNTAIFTAQNSKQLQLQMVPFSSSSSSSFSVLSSSSPFSSSSLLQSLLSSFASISLLSLLPSASSLLTLTP